MKKILAMLFSVLTIFSVMLVFGGCKTAVRGRYEMWGVKVGDSEIAFSDMTEEEKEEYFVYEMMNEYSFIQLKGNDTFIMGAVHYFTDEENVKNEKYKIEYNYYGTYAIFDQKLMVYTEPLTEENKDDVTEMVIKDGKIYRTMNEEFSFIFKK